MAKTQEERDQHLAEVSTAVPSSADIRDVHQDICAWFERQDAPLDQMADYQLTTQLHAIGQSTPWLIRAFADSSRIAKDKPITNVKAKRTAADRFAFYITAIVVSIGVCAFYPKPLTFLIAVPVIVIGLWLLVRGVLRE